MIYVQQTIGACTYVEMWMYNVHSHVVHTYVHTMYACNWFTLALCMKFALCSAQYTVVIFSSSLLLLCCDITSDTG